MKLVAGKEFLVARSSRSGEQGWALLGLLLALMVMSIFLVSAIIPDVQKQVQRDKEAEMLYRGQQMAEGIARYYSNGALQQLRIPVLQARPLTELQKLRDGITIGTIERKFVRPSAMIDPVSGDEWQVVRAGDHRLWKFLQAWLTETQTVRTDLYVDYFRLAGQSQKSVFKKNGLFQDQTPAGGAHVQPSPATNPPNQQNPPPIPGGSQIRPLPNKGDDDDDDDDDDDVPNDPLANLFKSGSPGQSNAPIIGVAPKKKGKAMTAYFGLENYEDWVFIYIPRNMQPPAPVSNPLPGGRNRISQ